MRPLQGFGIWMLAGAVALGGSTMYAQSGQGNGSGQNNGGYGGGSSGGSGGGNYSPQQTGGYGGGSSGGSGSSSNSGGSGMGHGATGGVSPATVNNMGVEDIPQNQQQMEQDQAKMRNADRQKQLIADTQKLVDLANQLKTDVDKSNKDMLSLDVVRKADEIEKLARSVREKMKNAN